MYYGVNIIEGNLRKLLSTVITSLTEFMEGEEDNEGYTGIEIYDNMTNLQRLTGLYIIAQSWFTENIIIKHPTLIHDAIIGAIIHELEMSLRAEIDEDKDSVCEDNFRYYWRKKIRDACIEMSQKSDENEENNIPQLTSNDIEKWEECISDIEFYLEEDIDYTIIKPKDIEDELDIHFNAKPTVTINQNIHIPMITPDCWIAKKMKQRKEEDIFLLESIRHAIYSMNREYNSEDYNSND